MKVELLDMTRNPEELIGRYMATCYGADFETEACLRRAASVIQRKHLSALRCCNATFEISGISRNCSHQLVRHAHFGYMMRSQRYVDEGDTDVIVPDKILADKSVCQTYLKHAESAVILYRGLRAMGHSKEDSRFVLPSGASTVVNMTGNFQSWWTFLYGDASRLSKRAQWEIHQVAIEIEGVLSSHAPHIFGGFNSG